MTGTTLHLAGGRRRISRVIAVLAVLLAAMGIVRPVSSAAASLPGPSVFTTGLADDPAFVDSTQPVRSLWLARAKQVGSSAVRIAVVWSRVAPYLPPPGFDAANPGDPSYTWSSIDGAIRTATADHQSVELLIAHAPTWAEAPGMPGYVTPGAWDPRPAALAAFAHAIALRYSGTFPDPLAPGRDLPRVRYFQAWNEPNLPLYLMPQWVQGPHHTIVPESPVLYRALLNAFYAAVKAVQPHGFVVAAGTAPYGDPPGVNRMAPLEFLREMFCLTSTLHAKSCPNPPHLDALDHHPYGRSPAVRAARADDVAVPDIGKIWRVLRAAQRAHHVLPAGPKSVWITEIDWSTSPPAPLSQAVQAAYLSQAFYELWSQGVSQVDWFQLRDPPGQQNSFAGAGLYYADGAAKLAATAFHFPFVALPARQQHGSLILWGKAPVRGRVQIQKRVGSRWQTVRTLRTTPGGIFYSSTQLSPKLQYRARLGAFASLGWLNH